jgi:chloramphenicol-sensitive protein RarD
MNNGKHYASAIAAFVIWGFFSIPLRALQNYTAGDILYFRILFSLVVLLIIAGIKRNDVRNNWASYRMLIPTERKKVALLTLAGGALLTINWLAFIYVVNNINIKTASFSYLICPVITAVLGYVLLREKMSRIQWIAVGLCTLSCILMGISSALELGFSFLTAFTYALYLVSQRRNQGFDRILILCIQVLFSFLIISLFMNYLVTSVPDSLYFYGVILVIAIGFTVLPLFLNLFALNKINSATIGILMYINPLINFTVAFIVFRETVNLLQIIGYSIIAAALIIFNYQNFGKIRTAIGNKPVQRG